MGDRPDADSKCTRAPTFVLNSCVCTEREVRWSFFLLVVIITLVATTLALFLSAVRYVKTWVAEKQRLRAEVKALSRQASAVMRDAHQRAAAQPSAMQPSVAPYATQQGNAARSVPQMGAAPLPPQAQPPSALGGSRATPATLPSRARTAAIAAADPLVHELLDAIEAVRLGSCGRGFAFAVDSRGGVWAHGKTRHLARGATGRVPGFHRVCDADYTAGVGDAGADEDVDGSGSGGTGPVRGPFDGSGRRRRLAAAAAPRRASPLADMIAAARRGGGYVHFRWKREVLMMAYVHPVKGTDLVLGGAVPVPRKQKAWEESNAKSGKRPAVRR
nr:DNA pol iii gamma/tau subunit-like domain [Pandoravirus massiliensis]